MTPDKKKEKEKWKRGYLYFLFYFILIFNFEFLITLRLYTSFGFLGFIFCLFDLFLLLQLGSKF